MSSDPSKPSFHAIPSPHPDYARQNTTSPDGRNSLAKIAKKWLPENISLETLLCTVARVANRLIDRTTGIPYSADELQAKVLANLPPVTTTALVCTLTNDDAGVGELGQYVAGTRAVGDALPLAANTTTNLVNIALTEGDWDVEGVVSTIEASATVLARGYALSTTSADFDASGNFTNGVQTVTTSTGHSLVIPRRRISIAGTTNIYLVVNVAFSAGTVTAFGQITARRVR